VVSKLCPLPKDEIAIAAHRAAYNEAKAAKLAKKALSVTPEVKRSNLVLPRESTKAEERAALDSSYDAYFAKHGADSDVRLPSWLRRACVPAPTILIDSGGSNHFVNSIIL